MRKVIAIVAIGLGLAWGGVQAENSLGWISIQDYAEKNALTMQPEDLLMMSSWECYQDTLGVMQGIEIKNMGVPFSAVLEDFKKEGQDTKLVKVGYQYDRYTDDGVGDFFAQCLIEAHKKITSK